ncbi:hypothetical protein GCM10011576_22840 [Micromonospora parathelypteridis]|nr:hypothetical protein GCM10011576_22840 [Micromonospora parathelypteridis]
MKGLPRHGDGHHCGPAHGADTLARHPDNHIPGTDKTASRGLDEESQAGA